MQRLFYSAARTKEAQPVMSQFDRDKWNTKYSDPATVPNDPAPSIVRLAEFLPKSGRALDLAGGAGRHSIWLAKRGLDVTLADVSTVGLQHAKQRAADDNVSITLCETDLEPDGTTDQRNAFPLGPWDLVLSHYYYCRALFPAIVESLAPAGMLVIVQPTIRNLERNSKPPRPFLLEEGELQTLAAGLEIETFTEGWTFENRHEAALIARRPV